MREDEPLSMKPQVASPSRRWTKCFAVIAVGVALFLPQLVTFGFRMVNGICATYGGLVIPAPKGWFWSRKGDALRMVRLPTSYIWNGPYVAVFLTVDLPEGFEFKYNAWEQTEARMLQRDGYTVVGNRKLRVATYEGYCVESAGSVDITKWEIRCIVPSAHLSATYVGNRAFASDFYSSLEAITLRKPRG